MTEHLAQRLRKDYSGLTRAEKAIASYFLANMKRLPFETAASIAESVGVSPMTVSRFLRTLGYNGLGELKERLRIDLDSSPLLISDRVERIRKETASDTRLGRNLELEIQATLGAYELRGLPAWKRVVGLLCDSTEVFLAGFQTISGIASDFAARLDYVRPGTSFLGGKNGTFSELFAGTATNRALLLFEMRRYTRLSFQLVQGAKEANIPMAIICDNHCYWARDFTDNVLPVSTESELFWDSQAPFLTLTNLLLDDVIARQGKKVAKRVQEMRLLQDRFEAFLD